MSERTGQQAEFTPDAAELLQGQSSYDEYWSHVATLAIGEFHDIAERNHVEVTGLEQRLHDADHVTHDPYIDGFTDSADIAAEWYLHLGSLNTLRGADQPLLTAAGQMWTRAANHREHGQSHEAPINQMMVDLLAATKSEEAAFDLVRPIAEKPHRVEKALLATQALLEVARTKVAEPDVDPKDIKSASLVSRAIGDTSLALASLLSRNSHPSHEQKQYLSDALKFGYEARYTALALRFKSGELSEVSYERQMALTLREQLEALGEAAQHMTNGAMNEHYMSALLRYTINIWNGDTSLIVDSATRRQDEPHDQLSPNNLPRYSIDATVTDLEQPAQPRLLQLKLGGDRNRGPAYAPGIDTINIFQHGSNKRIRFEMEVGVEQMHGLLDELLTGNEYPGHDGMLRHHVQAMRTQLNAQPAAVH